MRLAELQNAFQSAILAEGQSAPESIVASHPQTAAERFAIYQAAYRLRLAEFLANDYPVLRNVLGDADFGALAQNYVEATPSSHRNARWYGGGLPDFMRESAVWQEPRFFADIALLERALADAFDAIDADPVEAAALAAIAAEDQPRLRFTFQSNVIVLRLAQGVAAAHEAILQERDAQQPSQSEQEHVIVWRDGSQQAFYRVLDEDEALALDCANAGGSFAEICGPLTLRLSEEEAVDQAAQFLIRWFADGLIAGLN